MLMGWDEKYWDALAQLYWTPKYLGLKSIPRSKWETGGGQVAISSELVAACGSLYTRPTSFKQNVHWLHSLEEPLNHLFDLTFSIAADDAVRELLHRPAGIGAVGRIESYGRGLLKRLGVANDNMTQHDGFFVSPTSILAVELKLGSTTSPMQVLKYLALICLEEKLSGTRPETALIYITPGDAFDTFKQAGVDADGRLPADFLDRIDRSKMSSSLASVVDTQKEALQSLLPRVKLAHCSWNEFVRQVASFTSRLDRSKPGDATLSRLLNGFGDAVIRQTGTGAEYPLIQAYRGGVPIGVVLPSGSKLIVLGIILDEAGLVFMDDGFLDPLPGHFPNHRLTGPCEMDGENLWCGGHRFMLLSDPGELACWNTLNEGHSAVDVRVRAERALLQMMQ